MDIINPFGRPILKVEREFCGRPLSLEVNRLAFRSHAAVLATYGQTTVLAAVNVGDVNPNLDYFPLSVEYEERFYAAGKISGSRYIKREGRPSDDAVLTGRLIDRPIRPLFPKGYRHEVQAVALVLSLDPQVRADSLAMVAVSAAMSLTGVPFAGPISGVRVAADADGQLVAYPSLDQQQSAILDIMVASNKTGVMMVEAAGQQAKESSIEAALKLAHERNQELIALQAELIQKVGVQAQKYELVLPTAAIKQATDEWLKERSEDILSGDYVQRLARQKELKDAFNEYLKSRLSAEELAAEKSLYHDALETLIDQKIRDTIVQTGRRLDGRRLDEVRPLSSQVTFLPRVHGSALFTRGATQALNIVTLAPPSFAQMLDTMEREGEKYYFHHYNAPGYTLGEIKRPGTGRREIGHSYLAERALLPVLPNQATFPYSIRSVTEIMSQHGSTSMAATCSSCLALMDAGVPIKAPVAGVAMGLIIKDDGQALVLTDIADAEDFAGDMDFKIAGSPVGITALQMDMKVAGLSPEILVQALKEARTGREFILKHMLSIIERPRTELSELAPRVETLKIAVNKIKDVIGKGGETIHALTADTGAQIDVKDDGTILIFAHEAASLREALRRIKALTEDPEVGSIYHDRPVVKVADFGVFVQIVPGQDGLVHVSEISADHVRHPSDVLKEGDKVSVKLIAIDEQGRLSLSMKKLNEKSSDKK